MQITINPNKINNFHNAPPLDIRVRGEIAESWDGPAYRISRRQARRIEQHFCGVADCRCPRGGVVVRMDADGQEYGVRLSR